jgi:hypothetical protein
MHQGLDGDCTLLRAPCGLRNARVLHASRTLHTTQQTRISGARSVQPNAGPPNPLRVLPPPRAKRCAEVGRAAWPLGAPRRLCRASRRCSRPLRRAGGAADLAATGLPRRWPLRWPRRACTQRAATCRRKQPANASSWCALRPSPGEPHLRRTSDVRTHRPAAGDAARDARRRCQLRAARSCVRGLMRGRLARCAFSRRSLLS